MSRRWMFLGLVAAIAFGCGKGEGTTTDEAAAVSATADVSAAPAASAKADAKLSAKMGGTLVAVGDYVVELMLFQRGFAEAWVFEADGKAVAKPGTCKLSLKQSGDAGATIEMGWSEPDARFSGSTQGDVPLARADVTVELEVGGKVATGVLASPVLLVGPTFGGTLFVATNHGAEVAIDAAGTVEARLSLADGALVEGGIDVAANVEAAGGVMQRVVLAWDADLGRFRGDAKAEAKLATGPFVLFIGGDFAGRLPKLTLRAAASHDGYVMVVGGFSVELVVEGDFVSAFVVDASGKADVTGELDIVLSLAGGAIVKLAWDAPSLSYKAKVDAKLDLDAQDVKVIIKAGAKVSVGGFAAGSLGAKAKLDAKLDVDVDAKADLDAKAKAALDAKAKAKADIKVPEVKADAKAGSKGKGKAGASAGFSIGK